MLIRIPVNLNSTYQRQWEEAQAGLTDLLEVEEEELLKKEKVKLLCLVISTYMSLKLRI